MPAKPKLLQLLPCSPASTAASLAPRDEYSFSSNSLILPEICFPKTAQNWKGGEEKTACSTRLRILSGRGSVGLGDFFHPILFPCSDGRSRRKMLLYVHIVCWAAYYYFSGLEPGEGRSDVSREKERDRRRRHLGPESKPVDRQFGRKSGVEIKAEGEKRKATIKTRGFAM